MSYSEDLRDPRWQRKRLEILQRDDFTCIRCGHTDRPLVVHHRRYVGKPWECPERDLETLCDPCHVIEHQGGQLSFFWLRPMIEHAHECGNWDEVWKISHFLTNYGETDAT